MGQGEIIVRTPYIVLAAFVTCGLIADTKVTMEQLPAAVQKTVKEQTQGATLVGLSKATQKGKTLYEVETKMNGKTRDLLLDATGAVVSVEDEIDMASVPAAAKAAIEQKAAGAVIEKVESVKEGSNVSYEATFKTKAGKRTEFAVNSDGTPHK